MTRCSQVGIGLVALLLAAVSGTAVFVGLDRRAAPAPCCPALVVVVVPGKPLPDSLMTLPTSTPMPMPTPTPIATATPTPTPALDVRAVSGTGGLPLLVRATPGGLVIGALPEGDLVIVTGGPRLDDNGAPWYRVTQHGEQAVTGWVLGQYLAMPDTGALP